MNLIWVCPECETTNTTIEPKETVTCHACGSVFETDTLPEIEVTNAPHPQ